MFSPDHKFEIEREMPAIKKITSVFMEKMEKVKVTIVYE